MTDTKNNQIIDERLFLFSAWWQLNKPIKEKFKKQEAGIYNLSEFRHWGPVTASVTETALRMASASDGTAPDSLQHSLMWTSKQEPD